MSRFDDFMVRLEAALEDEQGRGAFMEYLQQLTPGAGGAGGRGGAARP